MIELVKEKIFEIKAGKSSQSSKERELQKANPRKYTIKHVDGDNPLHDVRESGRKAKKVWDDLP